MADQAVWIRWTTNQLQLTKLQVVVAHVDDLLMGGIRQMVDDTKA